MDKLLQIAVGLATWIFTKLSAFSAGTELCPNLQLVETKQCKDDEKRLR